MIDLPQLTSDIRQWALELGFAHAGIAQPALGKDHQHLLDWLAKGQHGSMDYMARNTALRAEPEQLVAGTCRAICVRKDYGSDDSEAWRTLADGERAYVARYALGRDYHKLMRRRLQQLADRIGAAIGSFGYRVFVDSAPVLERALARDAGLGWIGKHRDRKSVV